MKSKNSNLLDGFLHQRLHSSFPNTLYGHHRTKCGRVENNTIGRIVTCHPIEGERYYLRLLLMNVRGPKSYEDLRTMDGRCYTTFREATEKKRLITL
ncbi:hypothetical protein H5410_021453 [Solanum commersonii]|uniref:Uncharacterized protein n=1 Tax=Solanum commersonii TaxID=4109 RepID=A0A9J5ZF68_SOLCO|nr:hypothetical protein H5410_021453 [Solanum commersonii]